ncbi:uncharacterized protein TOT_040000853 [Theileria orientalis strain Shintoku]|uniref:Uncharacterized protein n=1 Tax=Theileria orientalis strain Shintoku TaxID=869250 RepID=J7MH25_THEOR|nr:uncharacterized protein TOT_040000853 [Theileria orientalis strain Shintoku]BAM42486.1 uncharacterized protein TOT_040000853 [Theileria orientalis strain Shintoku]|eukprot:XP_009692787.1 uncharacterized protein TOT_040000853 [Theileria orientalis strain Shintoku]
MNFHNTLIWSFIYLNIYIENIVESTDNSPVSSSGSDGSNLSTAPPSNVSTDDVDISTVDTSGFGIGWNRSVSLMDSNYTGLSRSLSTTIPDLSKLGSDYGEDDDMVIIDSSDVSSGGSSSNNQCIPIESCTSNSLPPQKSNKISVYNDSSLLSMIKTLSQLHLIDFIDSLANKLITRDSEYDIVKDLHNFIAKANLSTQPILLDLTELLSSGEYKWKSIGDTVLYTAIDGYGFKLVMKNTTVLWHTNEIKDYATKIECNNKSHTVTIHKSDGNTQEIKLTTDQETSTESDTPECQQDTAIKHTTVLNINKLANCREYRWRFSNGLVTCIANEQYGFRIVRQDNNVLWHTINRNQCPKKVECDYPNRKVTIHMLDGTTFVKHFEREPEANTLITIDIQNVSSTKYYTYEKFKNYAIYQPIWPYRVKKVQNDGVILWWYRDNMHPHTINVSDKKDGKRTLVLYFESDAIEFIDPTDNSNHQDKKEHASATTSISTDNSGSEGKDFSSDDQNSDQSSLERTYSPAHQDGSNTIQPKVKLLKADTADATKNLELSNNEYSSSTNDDVVTYQIANGVNCTRLMIDDVLLWEYDQNQREGKYPKLVEYYSISKTFVIIFDEFYIVCEEEGDNWVCNITDTSGVKLFTVDPNDNAKVVELDNTQLTLIKDGFRDSYQIAQGVNCVLLKYNGVLLWQYDPNIQCALHPKSLDHDIINDILVLRFEGLGMTIVKNDQGQWVFTESGPLPVKFHVVDPNDATKTVELASNNLTVTPSGDITTFTIADNVNCTKLTYGQVLLWQHDANKHSGKHPISLNYDTRTEVLVLKFKGLDITFAKNQQGVWIYNETGPLAIKLHVPEPNDPNNTVELDTTQFTVTESGDMTTFTIADNVDTIALTYGSVILWQHDPNKHSGKHPKSLVYTRSTETLVLKFEGIDVTFAKNNEGVWEYTETDTSASSVVSTSGSDDKSADETSVLQPSIEITSSIPQEQQQEQQLDNKEETAKPQDETKPVSSPESTLVSPSEPETTSVTQPTPEITSSISQDQQLVEEQQEQV